MLSKKIELNFSKFFKTKHENKKNNNSTMEKKRILEEKLGFEDKVSGFAIGFFSYLVFGASVLGISLYIL